MQIQIIVQWFRGCSYIMLANLCEDVTDEILWWRNLQDPLLLSNPKRNV